MISNKFWVVVLTLGMGGCFVSPRSQPLAWSVNALVQRSNSDLDMFVGRYANALGSDSSMLQVLKLRLDSLTSMSKSIKNRKFQYALQQYLADAQSMSNLIENSNLNLVAFANTLSSLNRTRANLIAYLNRKNFQRNRLL